MAPKTPLCVLCRSGAPFELFYEKVRDSTVHKVMKCSRCGHIQLYPIPEIEDDEVFYAMNDQGRNIHVIGEKGEYDIEGLKRREFFDTERRSRFVADRFFGKKKLLDVGCGHGFFLEKMLKSGFDVFGIEISKLKRAIAQRVTGAPIEAINLLKSNNGIKTQYDVITLFQVLEHLSEPLTLIRKLKSALEKDGVLIIEVPNLDDLLLTESKGYKDFYFQRAHLSYFTSKSLNHILTEAGFKRIEFIGTQRYGIHNFANWLINGNPQLTTPQYETNGPYKKIESAYKHQLEVKLNCDTITAVAINPG